jgi:tetratricopeptide (TPR) repeat protein
MMADPISHEAPARKGLDLPVMLPGKLIGRDDTLRRVYARLKDNKAALIYGASGIGKTALAATLANAYTELPGGVLWLTVDNTPFAELLVRVGRAYGITELITTDNPQSLVGAAAATLTQHKPLIVFDGKPDAAALSEFITRCADGLPVLIAADSEISGEWTSFPLGKLDPDPAAMLYRQLADGGTPMDGLNTLTAALEYTPFAIAVAAGISHLTKQTPAQFLTLLPPQAQSAGVTPQLSALTAAFRALTSAQQGLLLVMGATLRGEASAELVSLIAGAPVEAIQTAMSQLAQYRLIEQFERYSRPYYRLHPITHLFAQSWLRGKGRLDSLQTKFRDSVLAYAKKHSATQRAGHDHLAAEIDNLTATAERAADLGDRDMVNALIVALSQAGDFVNTRGYVYELLSLRRFATSSGEPFPAHGETPLPPSVPPAAPAPSAPPPAPTVAAVPLPVLEDDEPLADSVALENGNPVEDEPEIEAADELENDQAELVDVSATLRMFEDQDDDLELEEEFEEADEDDLELEEEFEEGDEDEIIDEDELASTSDQEAVEDQPPVDEVTRLRGQIMQARQSSDRRRQADLLSALGQQLISDGKDIDAIPTYAEALNLYEALNDSPGMLSSLEALAETTTKTENLQAAVLHASRGVRLAHQLHRAASEAHLLILLGDAHQQLGESDDAIRAYSQALDLVRANDGSNEALVLYKLGYAQLDSGDPEEAIDTWEESLALFRAGDQRAYEGKVLGGLGMANSRLERWREAISFHTSALHIAREVKDRDEERQQLSLLGYACIQAKDLGQAVLRYRQALHLAYQSGAKNAVVSTTVDLARLLIESPRHLDIADMLIDVAQQTDPNDRDLFRLQAQIDEKRVNVTAAQAPVVGTAQQYAANAYALLDS